MRWGKKPKGWLLHAWINHLSGYVVPLCNPSDFHGKDVPTWKDDGHKCSRCKRKVEK
jgi:hypothetical protein